MSEADLEQKSRVQIFRPRPSLQGKSSSEINGNKVTSSAIGVVAGDGQYYYVETGALGADWSYIIRLAILHSLCVYGFYEFFVALAAREAPFYKTWFYSE